MKRNAGALMCLGLILTISVLFTGCSGPQTDFNYPPAQDDPDNISFYQASPSTESYRNLPGDKVTNIIFCIGDGMGLAQTTLASIKTAGPGGKLHIERMPITGLVRTHSANALVTDSAASGTALATGVKTNNGIIGMTRDRQRFQTILEAAKDMQMATGLVATSTITHATPAAFASHIKSRNMEDKIAEQLLANKVNVLLGGGRQNFLPQANPDSKRTDDKDLISEAISAGYKYIQNPNQLKSAQGPFLLGLFQIGPLTTIAPEPTLAELTNKAIEILNRKADFFLMVEGSQIDWACHDNNTPDTIRQTLCFDQAVKAAIDFAIADGRTLVVVTADHETGGLTIPGGSLSADDLDVHFSTKGHSALPVPIYAFGPGANMFSGVYDNTEVPKKFAQLLGIKPFPKTME